MSVATCKVLEVKWYLLIMCLSPFTVPLQPRNLQARAVSPNEIEITWDPPEDVEKIISYTLYYNDSEKHQTGQIKIQPPATQYRLTELVPNTTYHIQLAARSIRGEGARTLLIQEQTPVFSKIFVFCTHNLVFYSVILISFFLVVLCCVCTTFFKCLI